MVPQFCEIFTFGFVFDHKNSQNLQSKCNYKVQTQSHKNGASLTELNKYFVIEVASIKFRICFDWKNNMRYFEIKKRNRKGSFDDFAVQHPKTTLFFLGWLVFFKKHNTSFFVRESKQQQRYVHFLVCIDTLPQFVSACFFSFWLCYDLVELKRSFYLFVFACKKKKHSFGFLILGYFYIVFVLIQL